MRTADASSSDVEIRTGVPVVGRGQKHPPVWHSLGAGHEAAHAPQWLALADVSTQVPEHTVCPDGHWQLPDEHAAPAAHTRPHVPQLARSVDSLTHAPEQ